MTKKRFVLITLLMLLCPVTFVQAQVSIGIGLPNLRIGINLPLFPQLVPVPGYPVYYAPRVDANYFFYDGMFWVFLDDNWYAGYWYDGPWALVDPEIVPLFILRVPVRYYRRPPVYFRGWRPNAPPHWGEHWGHGWERHRRGWDRWNRGSVPARAPLPSYQRHYTGDRYPRVEQQRTIRSRNYRYQPHDTVIRRHFGEQRAPATGQPGKRQAPPATGPGQHEIRRPTQPRQGAPAGPRPQQPQRGGKELQRPAPVQPPPRQRGPAYEGQQHPGAEQRNRPEQRPQGREQGSRGQGQGQDKGGEQGRGHRD